MLLNPYTSRVKIGCTNRDMRLRWFELEKSAGAHLTPLMFWNTMSARGLESVLHALFASHRVIGEWFRADPVIAWIAACGFSEVTVPDAVGTDGTGVDSPATLSTYNRGESDELTKRLADAVRSVVERRVTRHGPVFTVREIQTSQTGSSRYTAAELRKGLSALQEQGRVSVDKSIFTWLG